MSVSIDPNANQSNDRQYPSRPIVAVGVVVVRNGSVLLVQRGAEPGRGQWTIPGGAVELGETVRQAAAREVAEECGVLVDITALVEVVDRVVFDSSGRVQYHYVLVDFLGEYRAGELRAASDISSARWVRLSDLGNAELLPLTLQVVRKAIDSQRW